jgi:pimeloyl-ACP methyl ester carboxylesterase
MYLEMGHQIILWNYRGYGQSTGSPSISASISDAQVIYNYCKANLRLDPVISHGYSIGGPPAVCLASSQPFKTLVVDRSFCNFVNVMIINTIDSP